MPAVPGHHNAFVRELVRGRFIGQRGADVTVPSVTSGQRLMWGRRKVKVAVSMLEDEAARAHARFWKVEKAGGPGTTDTSAGDNRRLRMLTQCQSVNT